MEGKPRKVQRITIEELRRKLDNKEPLTVLDVRNAADYGNSGFKIPGALRIPLEELPARIAEGVLPPSLVPEREVVAYCT